VTDKLPSYLSGLNPEQLEAVLHESGNLLILAGAGSGKTRVITTKIAWLIRERGLVPESILAVTFTNKAAAEMRERACAIEPSCIRANLRTFHSFGSWFLRRNAAVAGLDRDFTIYDDDDSTTLVRAAFPEMSRPEAGKLASAIARAKDYGLTPDAPDLDRRFNERDFRRRFSEYERRLRATGNVDFGDLISMPVRVLETEPAIRERTHSRFRVILVDEYQDSNVAQFELLKSLAGPDAYVCVVGDDDQSIYRFRGAEVRNILTFPEVFPDTTIIKLERNYRSYQSILDIASKVVERNEGRLGKTLKATRKGGEKPVLAVLRDQDEETAYCVRVVDAHLRKGGSFSDIAIMYRTNAQSLAFERAFPASGVPYRLVGALRFYEREEVKDALALLALASNPRDEVAFRRVANKPSRGVGEASLEAVVEIAFATGGNLVQASTATQAKSAKARTGLVNFASLMHSIETRLGPSDPSFYGLEENAENTVPASDLQVQNPKATGTSASGINHPLSTLVEFAVRESGLLEYHKSQDEVAGTQKVANLDELVNAASDYPATKSGLSAFLEAVELDRTMSSGEAGKDAVTLITMHNTKGLEFAIVIIAGMEQGLFPRDDDDGEDLEEQRRLFYVALTRAKDELHLTYCRRRLFRGRIMDYQPSRFLAEVPGNMLKAFGGKLDLSAAEAAGKWKAGTAVYHDDHGSGRIVKVSPAGEAGVCVMVHFETGRTLQFFPKFTGKLEIISD
jgi:DNA helicase-2/ATP-dependent DNA helicase PcrA